MKDFLKEFVLTRAVLYTVIYFAVVYGVMLLVPTSAIVVFVGALGLLRIIEGGVAIYETVVEMDAEKDAK